MSKLLKVTLEFDDKIWIIEGEEALRWSTYNAFVATLAWSQGRNPFDTDPIKWKEKNKRPKKEKMTWRGRKWGK